VSSAAPLALATASPGAPPLRRPREDALPEQMLQVGRYRDEGCNLFPSCLTCPLPHCRYDVAGGARTMLNRVRDDEIRRLRLDAGMEVDEIARRFRVSRRTVFRVLQHTPRAGGTGRAGGRTNGDAAANGASA
jgi:hypothetical protein